MSGYHPKGFKRSAVYGYWLDCESCEESETFFGDDRDDQAAIWVKEHRAECVPNHEKRNER